MMTGSSWHLYVARCSDNTLYTGVTTDLSRRLYEHNNSKKGAKYTRSRRPVTIVYSREFLNRSEAQIAESSFKKLRRSQKDKIISENLLSCMTFI